jgi:DNA-binding transcriptional ArsR family regulator
VSYRVRFEGAALVQLNGLPGAAFDALLQRVVDLAEEPWDAAVMPPGRDPAYRMTVFGAGNGLLTFHADDGGARRTTRICTLPVTYQLWYSQAMEAALRALADESRRTMLETLVRGPATAGELAALLPIARPGVSRHLRVLREAGLVEARQEAQRRVYSLRPEPLAEVDEWLGRYRALWEQRLDALHTEVARGKRERRSTR